MFECAGVRVCWCSSVLVFECVGVRVCISIMLVFECVGVRVCWCSSVRFNYVFLSDIKHTHSQ